MTEKEVYDKNRMIEEFGVTPKQFIDVKGLMGDKSDNIPGVPGVGEKTAFKLIKEYGSIENLLQNLENVSGKKLKENLIENSEQAIFSKKLATIITDVPVDMDLESIKSKKEYDNKGLKELFHKLQFKSLLSKIDNMNEQDNIEEKVVINMEYTTIEDLTKLTELINDIKEKVFLTFKLKDVNVYSKLEIEYIFINHNSKYYIINISELMSKDPNETIKVLKTLFENEEIKKVSHGLKNVYTALNKLNIDLKSVEFDSEIAAYLIDSSKSEYSLKLL